MRENTDAEAEENDEAMVLSGSADLISMRATPEMVAGSALAVQATGDGKRSPM